MAWVVELDSPRRENVILYRAKVPAAHPASGLSWLCMHLAAFEPPKYLLWASVNKIPEERHGIREIIFMGDGTD